MIPAGATWARNIGRSCVISAALTACAPRGTYANPRPDEVERRLAAQHERELGYEQRCRDDETARVARGETAYPGRCEKKAVKSDGA